MLRRHFHCKTRIKNTAFLFNYICICIDIFTFHIPAAGTLRHIRGRKGFWSAEQMATSPVKIRNLEHYMEISTQSIPDYLELERALRRLCEKTIETLVLVLKIGLKGYSLLRR